MRSYPSERAPRQRLAPSRRIAYAAAIRSALDAQPTATVEAIEQRTGAPRNIITLVRSRWRAAHVT